MITRVLLSRKKKLLELEKKEFEAKVALDQILDSTITHVNKYLVEIINAVHQSDETRNAHQGDDNVQLQAH